MVPKWRTSFSVGKNRIPSANQIRHNKHRSVRRRFGWSWRVSYSLGRSRGLFPSHALLTPSRKHNFKICLLPLSHSIVFGIFADDRTFNLWKIKCKSNCLLINYRHLFKNTSSFPVRILHYMATTILGM